MAAFDVPGPSVVSYPDPPTKKIDLFVGGSGYETSPSDGGSLIAKVLFFW